VRRGVLTVAALFLLVGFGGDGKQKQFRQLSREEAVKLSVAAANSERDPVELADLYVRRGRVLVGTWKSRNSTGGEAWLSIFRLTGVGDPDQACIWVWRAVGGLGPYGYEEVPSVVYGRTPDLIHDRCSAEVRKRGIAGLDQVTGTEMPPEAVAAPDVVGPFGPRPAGLFALAYSGGDGISLTGLQLDLPAAITPAACGLAGFVLDAQTEKPIAGASVSVAPSHAWSGVSDANVEPWPSGGVTTASDRLGAFAFAELPVSRLGFDVGIVARGYGAARLVHEECDPGDINVGDWAVWRAPTFADATFYPVRR
jgi:hypothetical protein